MTQGQPSRGPDPAEDVFERIADAVFAVDEEWRFTFLNEEAERLLEHEEEDLVGEVLWEAFPGAVDSTFQREYEHAMEAQEPVAFEEYFPPLKTWFEVRAYPSPTGLSVYFHDINERVRRRRQLRDHEEALQDAYRVVSNPDSSSSEKIQQLLDVTRDHLGTEYGLLSHLEPDADRYLVEAVSSPPSGDIEVGDTLPLEAVPCCHDVFDEGRTLALRDVERQAPELVHDTLGVAAYLGAPIVIDGEEYGTFCFFDHEPREDDFTDWQVTFVSLLGRWTSTELERARGERELERSNKRLAASNRRLERFTRAASHDMQEPARSVATHLQIVRDRHGEALGQEGTEHLDFAMQAALQMRAMVRGLLAYAEVETGEIEPQPVDLEQVLADVLAQRSAALNARDGQVTVAEMPVVAGNREQLGRLFAHLVDNAIRYSGEKPPRIHIDAQPSDGWWTISVEDEGVGIAQAYQKRVFDLFERLDEGGDGPAAGLGLAICQRIAERHGSEIRVDTRPGGGSRFRLELPAAGNEEGIEPPEPTGRRSLLP